MLGNVPLWMVTANTNVAPDRAFLDVFRFPWMETVPRVLYVAANSIWIRPVAPLLKLCPADALHGLETGQTGFSASLFLFPRHPAIVELFASFRAVLAAKGSSVIVHAKFVEMAMLAKCVTVGTLSRHVLYNLPQSRGAVNPWTVVCGI
jgi:hypothetical protein